MEEALKQVCMVSILSESTINVSIYGFVQEVLIDQGRWVIWWGGGDFFKLNCFFKWGSSSSRSKVNSTKSSTAIFWTFTLGFRLLLQIFVGVAAPTFCCEDFLMLMLYSYETGFGDSFPREVSHAEKRAA